MAVTTAIAGAAATALGSMYLDARFLFSHDLSSGGLSNTSNVALKFTAQRMREDRMLVYHNVEGWATNPQTRDNVFLIFEERQYTYRQFYECVGHVGNWLLKELDIQKKEIVAINGINSPEYIMLWLAVEALGGAPAFINCNLTGQPLIHCVGVCEARYMFADGDIRHLVEPCVDELKQKGCDVVWYSQGRLKEVITKYGSDLPRDRQKNIMPDETACLIYTSGTTGMPKATILQRGKEINLGRHVTQHLKLKPSDRMYTCLPLYHGAGHGLCVSPIIHCGGTLVLSRKFSHAKFWPEVRKSRANIIQYVGELCRYLVNAPPSPDDKNHNVEMAWGNGMRPDIWEVFRSRFGIATINELYAATDGLGSTFNANRGDFGKFAIARRGLIWHLVNGRNEKRVRVDVATEEILRDKDGFAVECQLGEPGMVVHRMDPATEFATFPGYHKNQGATEKRKTRNLFATGDLWFLSGDMMREDPDGCVYFVDRLGDTFRWKSENVSTNEVADVMGKFGQIAETNVVGVQVPRADGRCGLAAIVMREGISEEKFDFAGLARHATGILPRYAVPIFLRVLKQMETTGTFKMQKGNLKKQGVDPDQIASSPGKDVMYWLPPGQTSYVPFRRKDWENLKTGDVKL